LAFCDGTTVSGSCYLLPLGRTFLLAKGRREKFSCLPRVDSILRGNVFAVCVLCTIPAVRWFRHPIFWRVDAFCVTFGFAFRLFVDSFVRGLALSCSVLFHLLSSLPITRMRVPSRLRPLLVVVRVVHVLPFPSLPFTMRTSRFTLRTPAACCGHLPPHTCAALAHGFTRFTLCCLLFLCCGYLYDLRLIRSLTYIITRTIFGRDRARATFYRRQFRGGICTRETSVGTYLRSRKAALYPGAHLLLPYCHLTFISRLPRTAGVFACVCMRRTRAPYGLLFVSLHTVRLRTRLFTRTPRRCLNTMRYSNGAVHHTTMLILCSDAGLLLIDDRPASVC